MHNRFPHMLSGGEQQRIAIARSLASGAKLILADEPTGNLDVANGKLIVRLLSHLVHRENYTVVIVTHDTNISEIADVVLQMTDGKL